MKIALTNFERQTFFEAWKTGVLNEANLGVSFLPFKTDEESQKERARRAHGAFMELTQYCCTHTKDCPHKPKGGVFP